MTVTNEVVYCLGATFLLLLIWVVSFCTRCRMLERYRTENALLQYRNFLNIPDGQLLRLSESEDTLSQYASNMLREAIKATSLVYFRHWSEYPSPTTISVSKPSPKKIDIVLAYYKANPTPWLFELAKRAPELIPHQIRLFIYGKATDPEDTPFSEANIRAMFPADWQDSLIVQPLRNTGRCDHTYVYHIVQEVYAANPQVAAHTLFLKDSTSREASVDWLLQHLTNPRPKFVGTSPGPVIQDLDNFVLPNTYYRVHDQNQNRDRFFEAPDFLRPLGQWYNVVTQTTSSTPRTYTRANYGGVFMIPTSLITESQSRDTWIRAGLTLCYGRNIETGHFMERAWTTLLTPPPPA